MNLERKYNKEETTAINMSRDRLLLKVMRIKRLEGKEVKSEVTEIEAIATEETAEEVKQRRNENERRRIKQQGGLRPKQIFKYPLIDWDGKVEDVICEYPSTKQAIKYSKNVT